MTNQFGWPGDMSWEEWRDSPQREALVYGYVKQHSPWLLKPGVCVSPKDEAQIREFVAVGNSVAAQKIILGILASWREENGLA